MKPCLKKVKAVFLDRDGVINEDTQFISHPSELHLLDGAADAIRCLNRKGILVIVVTNQTVVARNLCTEEELNVIHEKLKEMLMSAGGASLDAIYYCPHHPEKHHPDGNPKYRIDCDCRKPKTGMIDKAIKDFGLSASSCVLIGDSARDIIAGKKASLYTILIKRKDNMTDENGLLTQGSLTQVKPDATADSLMEAVDLFLPK